MRIGFVVHFFDFRNDVRKVISLVSQKHEVVLFVRKDDIALIKQHAGNTAEVRVVDEASHTIGNKMWDNLLRFFGKLPKSVRNFYLMEVFKISLSGNPSLHKRAKSLLDLAMRMPKFLSYDTYLKNLSYTKSTKIDDIDQFICFTDISDSYLFARLLNENKPVKVYVYSWDHPCKQFKYSNRAHYMVWNEGIRQDMIELQGTPPEKVTITGASQFAYVHQFLSVPEHEWDRPFSFDYIYFGCAIGIPKLVKEEIAVIRKISALLQKIQSSLKLVVRPYPVLKDWSLYEGLRQLPNVVLDDQFRTKNLSVGEAQIMEKFVKIHFAKAFIHLGTTLGLEACFTRTPSLILDFPEFKTGDGVLTLHNFVHQYQNDKYLMSVDYPNIVRSEAALEQVIRMVEKDPANLVAYNREVLKNMPLKSFEAFATDLING
jgi:hypothetical protein